MSSQLFAAAASALARGNDEWLSQLIEGSGRAANEYSGHYQLRHYPS